MSTINEIQPGDVLMDPHNKTTMWRLLEVDKGSNRVRLVRSNKAGAIHGLVKDPSGHWEQAQTIQKFVVIANYKGQDPPLFATARALRNSANGNTSSSSKRNSSKRTEGSENGSAGHSNGHANHTAVEGSTDLLKFMKTFHESMARGIDEIIRSR